MPLSFGQRINPMLQNVAELRRRKFENEGQIGYQDQQRKQGIADQRGMIDYRANLDRAANEKQRLDEQERDNFIISSLVESGMTLQQATQYHYAKITPKQPPTPMETMGNIADIRFKGAQARNLEENALTEADRRANPQKYFKDGAPPKPPRKTRRTASTVVQMEDGTLMDEAEIDAEIKKIEEELAQKQAGAVQYANVDERAEAAKLNMYKSAKQALLKEKLDATQYNNSIGDGGEEEEPLW